MPNNKFRVGARTFKTVLSVFICLLISHLLIGTNGMYSAMTTFICMLPTYEESKIAGIGRIVATVISFIAGFLVLSFYAMIPDYYNIARIFVVPIVTLVLIVICVSISYERSIILCCTLFIMLGLSETFTVDNLLSYIVVRLIETIIGVLVAIFINKYIYPYNPEKEQLVESEENQ